MSVTTKDEQSEQVKQHHRMAAGAWVTGETLKDCEKKASAFRKVYANKKEIGPWSR